MYEERPFGGVDMELGHLTLEAGDWSAALVRLRAIRRAALRHRWLSTSSKCLVAMLDVAPPRSRAGIARRLVSEAPTVQGLRLLGRAESNAGNKSLANRAFQRMAARAERVGDLDGLAIARTALRGTTDAQTSTYRDRLRASVRAAKRERDTSYRELEKMRADAHRRRAGHTLRECDRALLLASVAAADFQSAVAFGRRLARRSTSSWDLVGFSLACEHAGDVDEASSGYERALHAAIRHGDMHHRFHASLGLARHNEQSRIVDATSRRMAALGLRSFPSRPPPTHFQQSLGLFWAQVHDD
ncbi:MAG TPA: hypothetical protein VGG39_01980 [Polyangiaceae bacterium]|jgi:hypothetical protein